MHPPMGPPPGTGPDRFKAPKPESIKEVPPYLKKMLKDFFFRLFYIFRLVWEAKPWILFAMTALSVFSGVLPVIQSYLGAFLLNDLAGAYTHSVSTGQPQRDAWNTIVILLALQFVCIFAISLVNISVFIYRIRLLEL